MKKHVIKKPKSLSGVIRRKVEKPKTKPDDQQGSKKLQPYTILNPVEQGSYGHVSRALQVSTGQVVAVKRLKSNPNTGSEGVPITVIREIKCLQLLEGSHHVVKLLDVISSPLQLVLEFCEHDLKSIINTHTAPFGESAVKRIVKDILTGLDFIHSHGVIHRDIKPANLLYTQGRVTKIADFGLARLVDEDAEYTREVVSLWYRAPEVLRGEKYTTDIDVWAVGCVTRELDTGKVLLRGRNEIEQLDLCSHIGDKIRNDNFLKAVFEERLSAAQLLYSDYFARDPVPKERLLMPTFPSRASGD
ncbi:kinase-like domain-containing protein [Yarrowia lipolytica]|uniref:Cyclin-dependent kinase 8 n=2 Tax=Yarrowia lipolytica TaxID=4952 RepID=Q6C8H8_YARLI|nr:YALI0D19492p [Yarrowia lipolytica CLIB122]AOW04320.1 hypothetical protein YALI1_D24745g [Yarrowia lipolytica]KAB8285847.1 kinase-like domain-containing protein [Yarrowia lipolytica]KAE8171810.1 kinase-like domain-containing protein [Yarrowia lipolytica]KAJ8054183.1 kinase-like domain-containing protein [Yarrowia lipolytica]RDW26615.1 kinase-like domain-containing protein [Yarrowia lipolytica]|eukprot:XP_503034.1 YALI0D19492p [Yarrowia lipolytica CLIB122]